MSHAFDFPVLMKAEQCRAKATALRNTAGVLRTDHCREELLTLADEWDRMAHERGHFRLTDRG